jgi:hypothetical protein
MFVILAAMLVGMYFWRAGIDGGRAPVIDYSGFYAQVEQGHVKSVTIRGQTVEGDFKGTQGVDGKKLEQFRTMIPREIWPIYNHEGLGKGSALPAWLAQE